MGSTERVAQSHGVAPRTVARIAAGVLLLVVATAGAAAAHGGEGAIEVGEPEVGPGLAASFPVRITYVADGHPVEPEDLGPVTVEIVSGDASLILTDPLVPGDAPGVYDARVELPGPGTWELHVVSTEPPARASVQVTADEPAADGTTTSAPPTTASGADPGPPTSEGDDDAGLIVERSDGGSSAAPIVIAMAVCLVLVVGGVVLLRRARVRAR